MLTCSQSEPRLRASDRVPAPHVSGVTFAPDECGILAPKLFTSP